MNLNTAFTKRPRRPFLLLLVIATTGNVVAQLVHASDMGLVLMAVAVVAVLGAWWPSHKASS